MQLWAVMIVRNEVDILALNVLHHLSMGVDRFLIVDNGSTDGTGAVLGRLARDGPIRWTIDSGRTLASRLTSIAELAGRLGHLQDLDGIAWAIVGEARRLIDHDTIRVYRVDHERGRDHVDEEDRRQHAAGDRARRHASSLHGARAGPNDAALA